MVGRCWSPLLLLLGAQFGPSISGKLAFHPTVHGEKANHSLRILENEASSFWIDYCCDKVAIRSGDAAMRRRLVVAFELPFLHSVHAHKANRAVFVFENKSSTNLVCDRGRNVPVGLRHIPTLDNVRGLL